VSLVLLALAVGLWWWIVRGAAPPGRATAGL